MVAVKQVEYVGCYSRVRLRPSKGSDLWVQLVPPQEVDLEAGRISIESPLGKALIGRTEGETVHVKTPQGILIFEVLEVTECAFEQSSSYMRNPRE